MTHTYQTSVLTYQRPSCGFYSVEVEDFNGDYHYYEVEAHSFSAASSKAASLCAESCIDIYNMNIYKY